MERRWYPASFLLCSPLVRVCVKAKTPSKIAKVEPAFNTSYNRAYMGSKSRKQISSFLDTQFEGCINE